MPYDDTIDELMQSDSDSAEARAWRRKCMSLGGKLNYAAVGTRPDVAGALSMVMRHVAGANKDIYAIHLSAHLPEAYVQNVIHHCRTIGHNPWEGNDVAIYCDASQGCPMPMMSAVLFLNGSPVVWRIGRLQSTTLSSAEAEWFAQTAGATMLQTLLPTMTFMGMHPKCPILSFCDNKAAVLIAEADLSTKRMKHVLTRMAYLQERIREGLLTLVHMQAEGMLADLGTKKLPASTFHRLREFFVRPT